MLHPGQVIRAHRKRRRRTKLVALEILARAAEEVVKCTTLIGSNSRPTSTDDDGSPSHVISDGEEEERKFVGNVNGRRISFSVETFTDSDLPRYLNLNLNIGLDEENLTFKSLSEWSDYIKLSGETIKLPQHSAILPPTPLERISGHLLPNEIRLFQPICSKKQRKRQPSLEKNSDDQLRFISDLSNTNNSSLSYSEHKPIIIKLSRCNSDNKTIWKPVQLNNESFNPSNDSNFSNKVKKEQLISPSPNHSKNVHPRNSIGEEGLKCVPTKLIAMEDDVFCHRYVNDYNTQPSSSSSTSSSESSASSSSDESNSKKLLNFIRDTNNQHLCLSEDSSMDSSSD